MKLFDLLYAETSDDFAAVRGAAETSQNGNWHFLKKTVFYSVRYGIFTDRIIHDFRDVWRKAIERRMKPAVVTATHFC